MNTPQFHLAIDLDNTLLNTSAACITVFDRIMGINLTQDDQCHYRFYEFYGWTEEMYECVYDQYGDHIHLYTDPYPDAIEIIRKLYDRHQVTIMTARPEMYYAVTVESLRRLGIPFHELIFASDKFATCEKLQVDMLIDDAPHYALEFSTKGKQFMIMDQPYNRGLNHHLIYRVNGWRQVWDSLENICQPEEALYESCEHSC
jgi:uncharacterized HAD superfamily protein